MLTLGIVSFLAPRGDDTHGSGLGCFRYLVQRTLACFSLRRLRATPCFGTAAPAALRMALSFL